MAARRGIIQVARGDVAVSAEFRTERMEAHEIESAPEIVKWEERTDQPVVSQRYVKETHDEIEGETPLPSGTVGYREVNEDGDEVPKERISYYQVTPDGERERVEKRPSTVKRGEVLPVERWVDLDEVSDYLVDATYEVWGEEKEDEVELQRLAEHVEEKGEAPMLVWMLQPDFFKTWGILVPRMDEGNGEFSLLVHATRKRVEPEHEMPLMTEKDIRETLEEREEPFVEQEAP